MIDLDDVRREALNGTTFYVTVQRAVLVGLIEEVARARAKTGRHREKMAPVVDCADEEGSAWL